MNVFNGIGFYKILKFFIFPQKLSVEQKFKMFSSEKLMIYSIESQNIFLF